MPNSDLVGKRYKVDNDNLKKTLGDDISYENMKKIKSELEKEKISNIDNFNKKNGSETLKWIDNNLKKDRDSIDNIKRIRMNTGQENQFKKEHEKDRDNTNITSINLPNLHKGSMNKQIMSNKVSYNESINKTKNMNEEKDFYPEFKEMRYSNIADVKNDLKSLNKFFVDASAYVHNNEFLKNDFMDCWRKIERSIKLLEMNLKIQPENNNLNESINSIKYLIEYMSNNNKTKI